MPNQYKPGTVILATPRGTRSLRDKAHKRAESQGVPLSTLITQWITAYAETGSPVRAQDAPRRTATG